MYQFFSFIPSIYSTFCIFRYVYVTRRYVYVTQILLCYSCLQYSVNLYETGVCSREQQARARGWRVQQAVFSRLVYAHNNEMAWRHISQNALLSWSHTWLYNYFYNLVQELSLCYKVLTCFLTLVLLCYSHYFKGFILISEALWQESSMDCSPAPRYSVFTVAVSLCPPFLGTN